MRQEDEKRYEYVRGIVSQRDEMGGGGVGDCGLKDETRGSGDCAC